MTQVTTPGVHLAYMPPLYFLLSPPLSFPTTHNKSPPCLPTGRAYPLVYIIAFLERPTGFNDSGKQGFSCKVLLYNLIEHAMCPILVTTKKKRDRDDDGTHTFWKRLLEIPP